MKIQGFHRPAVLALLLVLAASGSFAADVSTDFDAANKLYERGSFPEAAAAYEKLIQSGPVSAAMYFNLGNARFKAGEPGRAIDAYRRAEQLAPRDPDLRANLQFVRNQIPAPTLPPNRWQLWLTRLTVNEWTLLAAVALWGWLLWLALRQIRPSFRKTARSLVWLGGILVALLCAGLGFARANATEETAVVIAREAVAHNGPLAESPAAFTAHDGAELQVLDRKDDWLQVGPGDRRVGWIRREQVLLPR